MALIDALKQKMQKAVPNATRLGREGSIKQADAGMRGGVEEEQPVRINIKRTIAAIQVAASSPYAHKVRPRKRVLQKALRCAMHAATVAPTVGKCRPGQLPERPA